MADNTNIKDAAEATVAVATDELSDSSFSPKVTLLDGTGSPTPISPATQATVAAILAKIIAAPATEAKQDTLIAKDFATQTTLAALLAKVIAAPSTEAKQDTLNTLITTIDGVLDAIAASVAGTLTVGLPSGASTSAKQDALAALVGEVQASPTANTVLDRLKALATALAGTLAVSAASLPLPSGAATEAGLSTIAGHVDGLETAIASTNTKLDTVIAKDFATQTTLAAVLAKIIAAPATEAKQDTGNTSLGTIAGAVKSEDAVAASGDAGVMALAVRSDAPGAKAADGDYHALLVGQGGRLHVRESLDEYEAVAASQTAQALGATGAAGDIIAGILVIPATLSPGNVILLDNATSYTVFTGGAGSVTTLVPFFIPLGIRSVSGAWKITTGANVSCIAIGDFT